MKIKMPTHYRPGNLPNPGQFAYRYGDHRGSYTYVDVDGDIRSAGDGYVEIYLMTWEVKRFTPCGFWIDLDFGEEKYIGHNHRKKFAHLNLDEARKSFKMRKLRQQRILKAQLRACEGCLNAIKDDKWSGRNNV
jgi:hypothetical protein